MLRLLLVLLYASLVRPQCEYSRASGFFEPLDEPYSVPGWSGFDNDPNGGDTTTVTFDNQVSVFSGTPTNTIFIRDGGLLFTHLVTASPFAPSTTSAFNAPDVGSFFGAYWFDTGVTLTSWTYSYRRIKLGSDSSGLTSGGSLCDLQRFANMVDDCGRQDYLSTTINEMLIVTHRFEESNGDVLRAQTIIGVDVTAGKTYIAFIYEDGTTSTVLSGNTFIRGYINGPYATPNPSKFAIVCKQSTTDAVHLESNCLCGGNNAGAYVFDVSGNECTATSYGNSDCQTQVFLGASYWPYATDVNQNCQLGVQPTDSCREEVHCQIGTQASSGASPTHITITLSFADPQYSQYTFLNALNLENTGSIDPITACTGSLSSDAVTLTVPVSSLDGTGANINIACGMQWVTNANGQNIRFAIINHDTGVFGSTNALFIERGYRIVKGTCNAYDLPMYVQQTVEAVTYPTLNVVEPDDRTVELFVSLQKSFDGLHNLPVGAEVFLGQDLFLVACYEGGTRTILENTEPYGSYPVSCYVAQDAAFTTQKQILGNGCTTTSSATESFHMQTAFTGDTNSGTNTEWCMSSGKIEAHKWIAGGVDTVYFKCEMDFCWNQAVRANAVSKCEDSCSGVLDNARRKRSDHTNGNHTQTVQTSVRLRQPPVEPAKNCMDQTIAIASVVGVLVVMCPMAVLFFVLLYKAFLKKQV